MPERDRRSSVVAVRHIGELNRRSPQRIAWLLGALALLLPFFVPGLGVAAAPRALGATPVAATPVAATDTETVSVYFVRQDWFGTNVVAAAHRDVAVAPGADDLARAEAALATLLDGPTEAEGAAGLTTSIPESSDFRVLAVEDGVASVDVSPALAADATATELPLRLAQIVFTLTGIPAIDQVRFQSEGGALAATPEGVDLSQPVVRDDFVAQTPPILVESPTVGETVTDPLRVQGTSNTYEGQFHLRVDAAGPGQDDGVTLAETVVQTSGSGTRGEFDVALDIPDDATGQATLVVFQVAPDAAGTVFDVTEIPIVLAP